MQAVNGAPILSSSVMKSPWCECLLLTTLACRHVWYHRRPQQSPLMTSDGAKRVRDTQESHSDERKDAAECFSCIFASQTEVIHQRTQQSLCERRWWSPPSAGAKTSSAVGAKTSTLTWLIVRLVTRWRWALLWAQGTKWCWLHTKKFLEKLFSWYALCYKLVTACISLIKPNYRLTHRQTQFYL